MARLSREDSGDAIRKATPLQRFGKTHEIADATIYLFSSAGDYVTGDIIVVDGGTWHRQGASAMGMEYPEAVTSGAVVTGVKGMKKDKSKL